MNNEVIKVTEYELSDEEREGLTINVEIPPAYIDKKQDKVIICNYIMFGIFLVMSIMVLIYLLY